MTDESRCCGPTPSPKDESTDSAGDAAWIIGSVDTSSGAIPKVSTGRCWNDRVGGWKARWGFGRMRYRVKPRLYAVGNPSCDSPVFVTANYKMSFDQLRTSLAGIDGWILVLDTKGINVWCAAGKGTFGTDELVNRIAATHVMDIVSHRSVIVPQLGAPGVAAHEVRKRSGVRVIFGPVRASDIPSFIRSDLKATPEQRRVQFPLIDRLAVAPVELVMSAKYLLLISAAFVLLAGLGRGGYSWSRVASDGVLSAALFIVAFAIGTIITPMLLPWLPGRALAIKGTWAGVALCVWLFGWTRTLTESPPGWLEFSSWCLIILVTTSFAAMNFSGSTTYTSLSGVRREMRFAVPVQAAAAVVGLAMWLVARLV